MWVSSKHLTCNCSCLIELTAQRYPPKLIALLPDTLETVYLQSHLMRGSSSMNRAYTHQVMCSTGYKACSRIQIANSVCKQILTDCSVGNMTYSPCLPIAKYLFSSWYKDSTSCPGGIAGKLCTW